MVTYIIMALSVALLAGFTGAMPVPALRRRHPGSAARPAAGEVERSLPPEILEALAKADDLGLPGEVVEHSSEQASRPSGADTTNGFSRGSDQAAGVLASTRGKVLDEIVDSLMQGTQFVTLLGFAWCRKDDHGGGGWRGTVQALRERPVGR